MEPDGFVRPLSARLDVLSPGYQRLSLREWLLLPYRQTLALLRLSVKLAWITSLPPYRMPGPLDQLFRSSSVP
jgi:hypothetical protein